MSLEAFAAWGVDAIERHAPSPADLAAPDADEHWVRAIDVAAPPALLWRWICQLRRAPYSYDWIDNLGKRSPQQLTPGLDQPAVGQTVLRIFRIASFARDQHLTVDARFDLSATASIRNGICRHAQGAVSKPPRRAHSR